jgi:hypothetical protein
MEFLKVVEPWRPPAQERLAHNAKSAIPAQTMIQNTLATVAVLAERWPKPFFEAPSSTEAFYGAATERSSCRKMFAGGFRAPNNSMFELNKCRLDCEFVAR